MAEARKAGLRGTCWVIWRKVKFCFPLSSENSGSMSYDNCLFLQVPAPGSYDPMRISSIASRVSSPSVPPSRYETIQKAQAPALVDVELTKSCGRENSYASLGQRSGVLSRRSLSSLSSPIDSPVLNTNRSHQSRTDKSSPVPKTSVPYSDSRFSDGTY